MEFDATYFNSFRSDVPNERMICECIKGKNSPLTTGRTLDSSARVTNFFFLCPPAGQKHALSTHNGRVIRARTRESYERRSCE